MKIIPNKYPSWVETQPYIVDLCGDNDAVEQDEGEAVWCRAVSRTDAGRQAMAAYPGFKVVAVKEGADE